MRKAMGPMKTAVDSEGRVVLLREFAPDPPTSVKAAETFAQWVRLPEHPALLRAIQVSERGVLVRYAALARELWREETPQLARLGAVLADVYATISPVVTDTARLAWPFVQIDAAGQIRIGFNPIDEHTTKLPPIVTSTFPRCDERTLVYVVGEIVADHVYYTTDSTLARVIDRCRARQPHKRYPTLRETADVFRALVPDDRPPTMEDHVVWTRIEQAMGWGELGHAERVIEICEPYRTHPRYGSVAIACEQLARSALERNRVVPSRPAPEVSVAWPEVEADGARLEAAGHLVAALQLYVCFRAEPAAWNARARVHLALGEHERALECARRALAADATFTGARFVAVKVLLARGDFAAARPEIDALVERVPDNAGYQYLRGKVLFGCGELDEARVALDHACKLQPTLLEAMLLRREVDRAAARARGEAGAAVAFELELPPSLVELRDVLLSGRTGEAIAALADARFAADADAQLLLARLHAFDGRLAHAAEIYGRLAAHPEPYRRRALVGKAALLLELGDHASALATFEALCDEDPRDADASEGRARALDRLGRTAEAEAEYRRLVAMAASRSDLRVRAAEVWLAEHAATASSSTR